MHGVAIDIGVYVTFLFGPPIVEEAQQATGKKHQHWYHNSNDHLQIKFLS